MKVCFLLAMLSACNAAGSSCAEQLDETSLVQVQSSVILAAQRPAPAAIEEETKQDSIPTDLVETGDEEETEVAAEEKQKSLSSLSSDLAKTEVKLNAALKKAVDIQPVPTGTPGSSITPDSSATSKALQPIAGASKMSGAKNDDKSMFQTDLDVLKDRYVAGVDALAETYKKTVDAETDAIRHDINNRNEIVRHVFDGRRAARLQPPPQAVR